MWTRRQFKVWSIAFALLVLGLLAALPVLADPGIRLGPPDEPAAGYAPIRAPAALPATGDQAAARPWHTVGQIPRAVARPHHTMFELRQIEDRLAGPIALPETGNQPVTRPWHTVGEIPRVQTRSSHSVFELIQLESGLAAID